MSKNEVDPYKESRAGGNIPAKCIPRNADIFSKNKEKRRNYLITSEEVREYHR